LACYPYPPHTHHHLKSDYGAGISSALADLGHEVIVFTQANDAKIEDVQVPKNLHISRIPLWFPRNRVGEGPTELSFRAISKIRSEKLDVVHSVWGLEGCGIALFRKFLNIPLVNTFHSAFDEEFKHTTSFWEKVYAFNFGAQEKIVARLADYSICVCSPLYEKISKFSKNCGMLPHGIDANFWINASKNKKRTEKIRLMYLGAVVPWKGVHNLINCIDFVDEEHRKKIEMVIAGRISGIYNGQDYEIYITKLIKKYRDVVRYIGYVNPVELPNLYEGIDIYVHPVEYMTASTAILEAMACGIPSIVTKVGGAVDYIEHMETGMLVQPNAQNLAEAIVYR
jgi:glycosyltransferase involved in cell wall biosynthesis